MGKIRVEPKAKGMNQQKYQELSTLLHEARKAAGENRVYYDLEPEEKGSATRQDLNYVARKEGINVRIRKLRKQHALELNFQDNGGRPGGNARIPAEDFKQRVLDTLESSGRPMKRGEILRETGLSASSWHVRIIELLKEGRVKKEGERRQAVYSLV